MFPRHIMITLCAASLLRAGTVPLPHQAQEPAKPAPAVTRSPAATPSGITPDYASQLDAGFELGFEDRLRFEHRQNDYRSPSLLDDGALFQRILVYAGAGKALDPLRFGVEFEDARRWFYDAPAASNDANTAELLQAWLGLHLDEALGDASLDLRGGRMTLDFVDRRLVARNRYRNSISAFDGFDLRIGEAAADWSLESFAVRPVHRSIDSLDSSSSRTLLYGTSLAWRGLSPNLVLEPYWLLVDQDLQSVLLPQKHFHTIGLHAYGQLTGTGWDYDLDLATQLGSTGGKDLRAWAAHAEAGYTFDHPWKPRASVWLNYASGDRNATDQHSQRFDSLYGASFAFYGYTSFFQWQNLLSPSVRIAFQPTSKLKCELMDRIMWLANSHDAWTRVQRSDAAGRSGDFLGHEIDLRATYQFNRHFELEAICAHLFPGSFVEHTGAAPDSSFACLAATVHF